MSSTKPESTATMPKPGPPPSVSTWWTDRRLRWHASEVASLDELSPAVRAALAEQLQPGEKIRQIVQAPRQHLSAAERTGWRRWVNTLLPWEWTPDWVLVTTDRRLLTAASTSPDATPVVTPAPIADIVSLELGTILLFAWFEWSWAAEGQLESTRIYFNTVSDRLFWETLAFLRRELMAETGLPAAGGALGRELLRDLPYKFNNLIPHRLLLTGERIEALVFQPEIWGAGLGFFRRQRAATTAVVLTNAHLLVTQEDRSPGTETYGLITHYCPRGRIREASASHAGNDLWLNVTLAHAGAEESLRILFEPNAEPQLQMLIDVLNLSEVSV